MKNIFLFIEGEFFDAFIAMRIVVWALKIARILAKAKGWMDILKSSKPFALMSVQQF